MPDCILTTHGLEPKICRFSKLILGSIDVPDYFAPNHCFSGKLVRSCLTQEFSITMRKTHYQGNFNCVVCMETTARGKVILGGGMGRIREMQDSLLALSKGLEMK